MTYGPVGRLALASYDTLSNANIVSHFQAEVVSVLRLARPCGTAAENSGSTGGGPSFWAHTPSPATGLYSCAAGS